MDEEIKQDYTAYTSIMDTTSASNESATSSHHHHNQRASVIGGGGGGASNAHQHHQQKHKQQKPPKQQPVTIQQTALPPMPPTHSKADSASEHSGSSGNNNSSSSSVGGDSTTQLSSKNPKEYHQQLQHRPRQQDVPSKEMQQRQRQQEKHEAPSQMIPKSAVKNHRMKKLLDENEELKKSKAHDVQEYERRCSKLQHSLDAKEAELSRLSVNFHNHVKTIRATDDDFSTIQVKLTTLQSKITALPLTLKKYAVDKAVMTRYFIQCWPDLTAAIEQLAKKKGALDYNVICLFVEKLVTEELVANIYRTPIMIGLPTNEAYMQISEYMATHDKDWALRLRQQMCKLAVKSLTSNNDPSAKPIATAKKQVVDRIVAKLANIYTTESHEAIISKVGKFVDLACELSVAMHSQDIPVDAAELVEGKDIFKDELVMPQNGSVDNATVIRVVICPPFTANEKQMNDVVLMKGKVICL
ncbi:hypothetical protein BDA99DRAFT_495344 [Phascolomyces articulosus]|uniref:Uncharacterized protein n=1 Tax=Phascolomyces articulosus TaxID=60185 RepID=A0AAD5PK73_9FUNG|nr:hypothetical protein BDA99DRAFT_495344 [Phascolomyces articulosus]